LSVDEVVYGGHALEDSRGVAICLVFAYR
jgi:hypothetical protein